VYGTSNIHSNYKSQILNLNDKKVYKTPMAGGPSKSGLGGNYNYSTLGSQNQYVVSGGNRLYEVLGGVNRQGQHSTSLAALTKHGNEVHYSRIGNSYRNLARNSKSGGNNVMGAGGMAS